jgi:protein associated with RNAse G/E
VDGQNSLVSHRVVEVKRRLDGSEARFACDTVLVEPGRRAVIRYVLDRSWSVPGVSLRPGMETYGHFWIERPFNAYHWLDGERTIAVYFNVGVVDEIAYERVVWRDYVIDILALPDGTVRVLDEDELPSNAPAQVRWVVATTRDELVRNIGNRVREVERETVRARSVAS